MRVFLQKAINFIVLASLLIIPLQAGASSNDIVRGWSWSSTIGWISMNSVNQGDTANYLYGVTFDDSSNLIGYAWSPNVGWICFGSTCTGTEPYGEASWAKYDSASGQVYGWAQIMSYGNPSGWISLNCGTIGGHDASRPNTICAQTSGAFKFQVTVSSTGSNVGSFGGFGWNAIKNGGNIMGFGWIRFDPLYTPPAGVAGTTSGVPWIQVLYGDLYAKGNISTPTPLTSTFQQINATYCIDTGSTGSPTISHFVSGKGSSSCGNIKTDLSLPKSGTKYSNILGRIKLPGYSSTLVPDLTLLGTGKKFPLWKQITTTTIDSTQVPDILGGKVYDTVSSGNYTMPARTFKNALSGGNGSGLIIIRGNLTIVGDVNYEATAIDDLKRLASLGILVLGDGTSTGNITIDPVVDADPMVANISSNIYAEGKISTGTYPTQNPLVPHIDGRLVINGVVIAKQFNFQRKYVAPGNSSIPAEQIVNDGRIVVNTPPGMNDFVASLPAVSY